MRKNVFLGIVISIAAVMMFGCGADKKETTPEKHTQIEEKTSVVVSEDKTENKTENKTEVQTETQKETEKQTELQTEKETKPQIQSQPQVKPQFEAAENIPDTSNKDGKIEIAIAGDTYFSEKLYNHYKSAGSVTGFLSEKIASTFKNADIFISNHEYVCSDDSSNKAEYQIYNYIAPIEREFIWKEMGADILTLANNHALDYGQNALNDTFNILDSMNIDYIGAGRDLNEALTPAVKKVEGKTIAVFAASRVVPQVSWYASEGYAGLLTTYESTNRFQMLKDAVKEAKSKYDVVIVYTHMGVEKTAVLQQYQKTIAHGLVDSGADLVVSSHPHVLQGMEFYNDTPIVYSMSNFLFENYQIDTMVLNVTVNEDNSCSVNVLPCISKSYKTWDVSGAEANRILSYIESVSVNAKIDEYGSVTKK